MGHHKASKYSYYLSGRKRQNIETVCLFDEIVAKISPSLGIDKDIQIHEAPKFPNRRNSKEVLFEAHVKSKAKRKF
jgi:hypothetical protein